MTKVEVSELYLHPIKSCKATSTNALEIGERGIPYDRHWMVVDADGNFITQREFPKMATIQPVMERGGLTISAPGESTSLHIPLDNRDHLRQVNVWGTICDAIDEGEAPHQWFSDLLGTHAALVHMPDDFIREKKGARFGYADSYPLLIASEESLADLNRRIVENGGAPVTMDRFRPNIVVRGTQKPYDEDEWALLQAGAVDIQAVKPCVRCPIPQIDQDSGKKGKEPIKTLLGYRAVSEEDVIFAVKAAPLDHGTINVGDEVVVYERKSPPKFF